MNPQSVQRTMKRNRPALSLSLTVMTVILLAGCKTTPSNKDPQSMSADLRIRVTHEVLHPVNKRLFGQFLEKPSWGGETGPEAALLPGTRQIDPRVEEMMRAMEIPVVRFPGGTDVDYLDWRDMVTDARGPGAGRPNSISRRHGGENDIITNGFGYDEYFQLAGRLGWETILVVNLRDGLLTETSPEAAAEHAAALLAYCAGDSATLPEAFRQWPELRAANGHPAPYPVEYVQIGNEAWWAEQMKKKHGDAWIQIWADAIESYIAALRGIAPDVKIIVDAYPLEISAELVRRKAGVDLYALHRYYPLAIKALFDADGNPLPLEKVTPGQIWDSVVHSAETDADGLAKRQDKAIDQARQLGFKLAMTEWNLNGWWSIKEGRELWPGPAGVGMGAAYMLQSMLRSADVIEVGTQSLLVGKSWGIAGIRVTKDGVAPPTYAPSAEVTTLYRKHHGDSRLRVQYETELLQWTPEVFFNKEYRVTEGALTVDVVATRDDKNLYLHILNTDYDQPRRLQVRFEGLPVAEGRATLHRLRFRTHEEQQNSGAWTSSETETLAVTAEGLFAELPSRSASIAVIPLQ
jgi:alpha-L-arabinofuranosidase